MSDSDSDDELLANLLASANDPAQSASNDTPERTGNIKKSPVFESSKPNALKELDFNFLDDVSEELFADETPVIKSQNTQNSSSVQEKNNGDSSDEEDKKYFNKQRYSDYGRDIKHMLKDKETEKHGLSFAFKKENSSSSPSSSISSSQKSNNISSKTASHSSFQKEKNNKHILQVSSSTIVKSDVYSDPIFKLRIVKPLISSAELVERMQGRKAVTVSNVKMHLQSENISDEDWVIAGVLMSQSTKTSQKGSNFSIWKISDLSLDMKKVTIFLFSSAYKNFWKTPVGSVIGILNPSVLDSKDDQDLATLSTDNAQKIMILGTSRDLGRCKSKKKNGDPCTAPVNLSQCEYCVYHVKQEYGKYSKRSDLQSASSRTFGPKTKNQYQSPLSQQRNPSALSFTAIPARRNEALYKKDCERLALLRGEVKSTEKTRTEMKIMPELKFKTTRVELSKGQTKKDLERLKKLREAENKKISSPSQIESKFSLPEPKLGKGMKGNIIDFSEPIGKHQIERAKMSALQWVKQNGSFKKLNPNKVRPDKEVQSQKGIKRKRDEENQEEKAEELKKKEIAVKSKFQEMLEMKSAHSDLIEQHQDEETEKYFNKLEVKEKMEEKMLTTFQVKCKAVTCRVCKYTAFSSSDLCKKLQHPIKVVDAVKRFFKCEDCGNRTISLDRIPAETCKRCNSSKWVRAPMMDEKRTKINNFKLCIRGGEESFIGADVTDASLNLLVPES